jgi:hypothetical protein
MLCPVHADTDPCLTMATVTGRRRKGTVRRGTCTACGHRSGTWPRGVPMGSRRAGETLPAYMFRHAHDWARQSVPDDLARAYAAWCRDAVTADPGCFDYWAHPAEYPVWLELVEVTR